MYTMISKMTQYKKYKTTRKKICMKIQVMKVKNHYKILMTKLWKSVNCKNLKNLNFCNKRIKTKSLRKIYKNSWELRMIKRRCCKVIILVKYNKFPNIIKTKEKIKKYSRLSWMNGRRSSKYSCKEWIKPNHKKTNCNNKLKIKKLKKENSKVKVISKIRRSSNNSCKDWIKPNRK